MRFQSIKAGSFGPHDGRLVFAPGLNLIWGKNETGKSSWMAALYAALCGIRRAQGPPRQEDREFEQRHRPWAPDARWYVEALIELDDGRHVEFTRDLGARSETIRLLNSAARNGREGKGAGGNGADGDSAIVISPDDLAGTIQYDGAPDGARLLGLTRDSFRAVAFVSQASILAVADNSDALRATIERAATSGNADSIAAKAIARLEEFRKEYVGRDTANASGPLRQAIEALDAARQILTAEQQKRREWEALELEADNAALAAVRAARELNSARATAAESEADRLEGELERARELRAMTPAEPEPIEGDVDQIERIDGVLDAWGKRPEVVVLEGVSADEIREQIEGLPAMPEGDLEPHADVADARQAYDRAISAAESHAEARPAAMPEPDVDIDPVKLEALASAVAQPIPEVPARLAARHYKAKTRADQAAARAARPRYSRAGIGLAAVGLLAALLGLLEMLGWLEAVGWLEVFGRLELVDLTWITSAGVAAVLIGVVLWFVRRRAERAAEREVAESESWLTEVEAEYAPLLAAEEQAHRDRKERLDECDQLGIVSDPAALRELAREVAAWQEYEKVLDEWRGNDAKLADVVRSTEARLAEALAARGASTDGDIGDAADAYVDACERRAEEAVQADKRSALDAELFDREKLEASANWAELQRVAAERDLMETAAKFGSKPSSTDEAITRLEKVREALSGRINEKQAARARWEESLQTLGGLSLDDFAAKTQRARERADKMRAEAGQDGAVEESGTTDSIAELEQRASQAREHAANLKAEAENHAKKLQPLADLEEAVAAAEADLEHVRELGQTLDRTIEFLQQAQDTTYRNIAPQLSRAVTQWLPRVTAGRYRQAQIEPFALDVHVLDRAGVPRLATSLSHGTAEQIYLLVRAALAEYMVPDEESCPLLLDEVTAHSDPERTTAILEVLRTISLERQVILCTHEESVRHWASERFREEEDRLLTLE